MANYVSIPIERYDQLIRAEQDANQIKSLLSDCYRNWEVIDRTRLALLNKIYFVIKEENE